MSDFLIAYDIIGVPDLQVGVTDTGQVGLVIATEEVTLHDPAQLAALAQVLEQVRVDQARIHNELHPPIGIDDRVRFDKGDGTLLEGFVTRAPWGTRQQNVSMRTVDTGALYVRLVANVELVERAADVFDRIRET
jgi:hypothetical protein